MTSRRLLRPALVAVYVLAAMARAETNIVADRVARYRATYEQELGKVEQRARQEWARQKEQYLATLDGLEKRFQDAGQLDDVLAVRRERTRFEDEGSLRKEHLALEHPELAATQQDLLDAVAAAPLQQARSTLTLAGHYDRALAMLQKSLTRQGRIDDAVLVNAERQALQKRPEVTAARFVVADAEPRPGGQPGVATAARTPLPRSAENEEADSAVRPTLKPSPPGSPQSRLRKRYGEFLDAVKQGDGDELPAFVDPDFVAKHGAASVKRMALARFMALRRKANNRRMKLGEKVEMGADETTATVVPRVWYRNEWRDLAATSWKLSDGEWHLDLIGSTVPPSPPARRPWKRPPVRP